MATRRGCRVKRFAFITILVFWLFSGVSDLVPPNLQLNLVFVTKFSIFALRNIEEIRQEWQQLTINILSSAR